MLQKGFVLSGRHTCNEAEYAALIRGLKEALHRKIPALQAYGDSKLVCYQVLQRYGVKAQNLLRFHSEVVELTKRFEKFHICHISRLKNRRADALACTAADAAVQLGDTTLIQEMDDIVLLEPVLEKSLRFDEGVKKLEAEQVSHISVINPHDLLEEVLE